MRLKDKVIAITGAASGMGRAMVERFVAEGARIVAADWNEAALQDLLATIRAGGGTIAGSRGDVSQQADAEAIIDKAVETFGRIDVLVNNAGILDFAQAVGDLDIAQWRKVLGVNLDGPMFTCRRAVPVMLAQGGGSIINIASTAALSGAAAGASYTVSKHGVLGLTRSTAWMYAKQGIRCNAIAPGGTITNIMASVDQSRMDPVGLARTREYCALIPQPLEALDIANTALFLASDESRFINGAVITADGGWTAA